MKLGEKPEKSQRAAQALAQKPQTRNRGKRRILFEVEAAPGSEVFVAGNFNQWEPTKHRLVDKGHPGQFRRHVYVDPGMVEYKFLIDGKWHIDAKCTRWAPNEFGTLNSVTDAS